MRLTKLNTKQGNKLTEKQLSSLVEKLKKAITKAGFITQVSSLNSSSLKIGMHMKCFVINTDKLGSNARVNTDTVKTKKSYVRTNLPTWKQREDFNHLINNVLDKLGYKANIKSGEYIIRTYEYGRVNQWDMPEAFHTSYGFSVPSVLEIVPIDKATLAIEWVGINAPFVAVCE